MSTQDDKPLAAASKVESEAFTPAQFAHKPNTPNDADGSGDDKKQADPASETEPQITVMSAGGGTAATNESTPAPVLKHKAPDDTEEVEEEVSGACEGGNSEISHNFAAPNPGSSDSSRFLEDKSAGEEQSATTGGRKLETPSQQPSNTESLVAKTREQSVAAANDSSHSTDNAESTPAALALASSEAAHKSDVDVTKVIEVPAQADQSSDPDSGKADPLALNPVEPSTKLSPNISKSDAEAGFVPTFDSSHRVKSEKVTERVISTAKSIVVSAGADGPSPSSACAGSIPASTLSRIAEDCIDGSSPIPQSVSQKSSNMEHPAPGITQHATTDPLSGQQPFSKTEHTTARETSGADEFCRAEQERQNAPATSATGAGATSTLATSSQILATAKDAMEVDAATKQDMAYVSASTTPSANTSVVPRIADVDMPRGAPSHLPAAEAFGAVPPVSRLNMQSPEASNTQATIPASTPQNIPGLVSAAVTTLLPNPVGTISATPIAPAGLPLQVGSGIVAHDATSQPYETKGAGASAANIVPGSTVIPGMIPNLVSHVAVGSFSSASIHPQGPKASLLGHSGSSANMLHVPIAPHASISGRVAIDATAKLEELRKIARGLGEEHYYRGPGMKRPRPESNLGNTPLSKKDKKSQSAYISRFAAKEYERLLEEAVATADANLEAARGQNTMSKQDNADMKEQITALEAAIRGGLASMRLRMAAGQPHTGIKRAPTRGERGDTTAGDRIQCSDDLGNHSSQEPRGSREASQGVSTHEGDVNVNSSEAKSLTDEVGTGARELRSGSDVDDGRSRGKAEDDEAGTTEASSDKEHVGNVAVQAS